MKKVLFILSFIYIVGMLQAQELTFEYNFGFGTYKMGNLKDLVSESGNIVVDKDGFLHTLKGLKVTDDFPGHWTHQAKIGIEFNKMHHTGIALDFMNTVGQKAVSDYSGSYSLKFRTKGTRLGAFYRISPADWTTGIARPYLMLTTGVVFNDGKLEEKLTLSNVNQIIEKMSFEGVNFFIEPAVGCKIRLHKMFALNINAGYQFDLTKKFKYQNQKTALKPDWSGLRVQGGLIYYVPLR